MHFFCQFLWTEKNTPPSYSLFEYIISVFRILGHILKFRVKSWRCRDSGRANQHQRHLDFGPWTRRRSAESILSTAHICNLLPLVLTCAAVQVKSITSTCLPPPTPHSTTVLFTHRGHCWGGGEGGGVKYNSKPPHHLPRFHNLYCGLELWGGAGNKNCLQSRNSLRSSNCHRLTNLKIVSPSQPFQDFYLLWEEDVLVPQLEDLRNENRLRWLESDGSDGVGIRC